MRKSTFGTGQGTPPRPPRKRRSSRHAVCAHCDEDGWKHASVSLKCLWQPTEFLPVVWIHPGTTSWTRRRSWSCPECSLRHEVTDSEATTGICRECKLPVAWIPLDLD